MSTEEKAKQTLEELANMRSRIEDLMKKYNKLAIESNGGTRLGLAVATDYRIEDDDFEDDEERRDYVPDFDYGISRDIHDMGSNVYWRSSSLDC